MFWIVGPYLGGTSDSIYIYIHMYIWSILWPLLQPECRIHVLGLPRNIDRSSCGIERVETSS